MKQTKNSRNEENSGEADQSTNEDANFMEIKLQ